MVISNKSIAIIGGGPGGLTLARLLQLKSANVKVYERDLNKDARVQGATLDLHYESGLRALREAGLMDAFEKNYRPGADRVRIVDMHGNIVVEDNKADDATAARPEIDRGPLRKILLESLQPGTVIWNSQFVEMKAEGTGWKIQFANGTIADANIVIAADGANSKIRPYITPIKPFYAGVTIVEGAVNNSAATIPTMHKLLNGGKIFAMGNNQSLIVSSKGDGSLVFYTGSKTDEDWVQKSGIDFGNKEQVLQWFATAFANWDKQWLSLFENATLPFIPRPQYCMPLDQYWESLPNLTMLGDAAHLMPPYAGEGVNMAMLDAVELSNALTDNSFTNTKAAIAHYETSMRLRAAETARDTLHQTEMLHAPGAIEHLKNVMS